MEELTDGHQRADRSDGQSGAITDMAGYEYDIMGVRGEHLSRCPLVQQPRGGQAGQSAERLRC